MSESNNKGAVGEALFTAQCYKMNIAVSKPFSESLLYDLIIDNGKQLLKIQVKTLYHPSTQENERWRLSCNTLSKYKTQVDYLAIYIQPQDLWYIIPTTELGEDQKSLYFYPYKKSNNEIRCGKNESFRNKWDLLSS